MPNLRNQVHYFDWHFSKGADWYECFSPMQIKPRLLPRLATPDYMFDSSVPLRIPKVYRIAGV